MSFLWLESRSGVRWAASSSYLYALHDNYEQLFVHAHFVNLLFFVKASSIFEKTENLEVVHAGISCPITNSCMQRHIA